MPLPRFVVKNEYGLADPELYLSPSATQDPKPALDGLAVAGLVGVLRQLGDLAELGAEIFGDLHEQVMNTGMRGKQISSRLKRIESVLPVVEKAIEDQSSHVHFAYITGCDWHANVQVEKRQLICSEPPQYILDSYEECRDPPQFYLLDKFDSSGAGACLMRYSDPSYFRRVIASLEPAELKKSKKRKKKRSQLRRREIQEMLRPSGSSSTQYASPGTDRLSFSVENVSTSDTISNFEAEKDSTLSDTETRPNFQTENSTYVVHNEPERNGSPASISSMTLSEPLSVLHNEPAEDTADDDSQYDSLKQQSISSSSSVMWDEKTEIEKPTSPRMFDVAQVRMIPDTEPLPQGFDTSNIGCQNTELGNSNQDYIDLDMGTVTESLSSGRHIDEVRSEADNYRDANNALESETEMDGESQTQQGSSPLSNFIDHGFNYEQSEPKQTIASTLNCTNAKAHADTCNSTGHFPQILLNIVDDVDHLDNDQSMCARDSIPTTPDSNNHSENHISDISGVSGSEVPIAHTFPESSTVKEEAELAEETNMELFKAEDPAPAPLRVPSFRLWTNGGMLGLEPSKPPDFIPLSGRSVVNSEELVKSRESITRNSGYLEENINSHDLSLKQNSQRSFQCPSTNEHIKDPDISADRLYANSSWSILSGSAKIESQSNDSDQSIAGSISQLAQRFLANNLQKRIVNHDDVLASSVLGNDNLRKPQEVSPQNGHQELQNDSCGIENEKIDMISKAGSFSPPLENMKISCHPMHGFPTSSLKLEYSRGHFHESASGTFQLIPGASSSLFDSCSESDEGTFCKSSYSSQDLLSPDSESNSEMWGEDERSGSQKHEISNNSSTTTSMSSLEFEKMDQCRIYHAPETGNLEDVAGIVDFGFDPIRDLPDIASLIFSKSNQQDKSGLSSSVPTSYQTVSANELIPPPLPPMQWRVVKPSHSLEDKSSSGSKVIEHLSSLAPSSVTLQQEEQDAAISSLSAEVANNYNKKTHNQPDEGEDFLQQIRTKSFNLRRTLVEQPNHTPDPAPNDNIVAILEKVDLVRQAIVSDNKEVQDDDSWSEG